MLAHLRHAGQRRGPGGRMAIIGGAHIGRDLAGLHHKPQGRRIARHAVKAQPLMKQPPRGVEARIDP